ncbi:S8 family serine peptidase [Ornithinimicrobium cerasi]|uniref:S8 family serine peptidase n=1 Tax=Ornithinimicrobium cerasi TaxID=2248773 RepID=UPI00192A31F3|nr:S8 family serine peptidase [Ornithinimicrobium cerasi]
MGQTSPRRGVRTIALAAAVTVASPLALSATAAPELQLDQSRKTYIVQLDADPIATYEGGTAGIPATKPAPGEKVKAGSANAKKYEAHLRNGQAKALKNAGVKADRKTYEYTVALNGFTAELTAAEAARMSKTQGVVNVWEDEVRYADTVTTPDYLGMTGKDGVWKTQFGNDVNAGKGMVVGVIDTGIDPENPSFAPLSRATMPKGDFVCDTGDDAAFECSTKIVGARWYGAEHGNNVALDYLSPRDRNGHGSHTAGTAAGNNGVAMEVQGNDLGIGSGMAPAAHVAVYKALWQTATGGGSGTTAGLVAAIDDAVADGVDVINYSVSGSSTSVVGPDEIAFLFAADAGIFVSTSAGNSGDTVGVSSVAHNAPWTMTVAASTHDRGAVNTLTLGNGATYEGVGYGGPLAATPMVLAASVAASGAVSPQLCGTGTLDDTKVTGKIVICDRGEHALVDKAAEVKASGGAGMVLVNLPGGAANQNAILYGMPATHLTAADGTAVKAYVAANPSATGAISATTTVKVPAPSMASFSSYGPALAGGGDLLKPDITAPGADVLAAVNEDPESGDSQYDMLSGTSMSAPHVAGLGALLKQKNPTWSPMAVKSAMMTTARQTDDAGQPIKRGTAVATPLNYGAGEVQPLESYSPGLVYDSGWNDWLAYACGIGQLAAPCPATPVDASDLNYPSIAVGDLAGKQTVTRTVTNVGQGPMTYTAKVEAPAGTTVTVSPSTIKVPAKGKATFEVTITRTSAALGQYTFGALTWQPASTKVQPVRSPIAVRPVALAAAAEVAGSDVSGSVTLPVTPGFTGTLNTDVDGLLASTVSSVAVQNPANAQTPFTVAAGTKVLRLASYGSEVDAEDIDLYLFHCAPGCRQIALSGKDGSDEMITLRNPAAGNYIALTDLWSNEPSVTYPLHVWRLGDTAAGNLTVSPSSVAVTQGTPTAVTAQWNGLDATKRYLGQVNFLEGSTVAGSTLVTVNP